MSIIDIIEKPAWNDEWRTCEFRRPDGTGPLNEVETVQSVSAALCVDRTTGETVAGMIEQAAPYNSTQVRYRLLGGTPGQQVFRILRIVSSNGQKIEDKKLVKIV